MKLCSVEGCSSPVWGKGLCKFHTPKKRIKSNPSGKKESFPLLRELYLAIWKERAHKSELSGTPIYGEPLSLYFHHIVPKQSKRYKDVCTYDKENIIILTWEEHQRVESDPTFYQEINERREKLISKYELIIYAASNL